MESGVEKLLGLTNSQLDEQLRTLELQRRQLDSEIAAVVAVCANRMVHLDDGHHSTKSYLRAVCNWPNSEINRVRKAASLIDQHPSVGSAWASGHLGAAQVNELAKAHGNRRCGDQLVEFLPTLLQHGEHLPFDDFRIVVQRFVLLADTDGALRDADAINIERSARVTPTGDGGIDIAVTGGNPISTAEYETIFERFVQTEFRRDVDSRRAEHGDTADQYPLPRTPAQRRHDAIHAIFLAAVTAPVDGKRPEPVVNIIIDKTTFDTALDRHHLGTSNEFFDPDPDGKLTNKLGEQLIEGAADLIDRRCETTSGIVVHPEHALKAALTGHVRRVVIDSAGVVINMGRLQRLFTGSARTAAQLLARTCGHAGCQIPATLCDVDHLEPWANNHGRTDQHNAGPGCNPHNRRKHTKRWQTRRAKNGLIYTIRADGTIILPVGERTPDFYDPEDDPAYIAQTEANIRTRFASIRPYEPSPTPG